MNISHLNTPPCRAGNLDPEFLSKLVRYICLAVLILGVLLLFSSCGASRHTHNTLISRESSTSTTERLSPVSTLADTADISFKVTLDKHKELAITEPRIRCLSNSDTELTIDSDRVSINILRHADTLYLPSREVIRSDTVYVRPEPTPPRRARPQRAGLYQTLRMLSVTLCMAILLLLTIRFVRPFLPQIR